ncbi:MAG: type II toxin-antitoxin system RelB/DinJ family antitoxin [Oscillibacter sp.]|nr:type II toxin-antitoxin system RelB/DinJ family antitoxin [Oscillibacter sp.]
MKSVNVTFQVDEDVKNAADALFNDLGMSLSMALNLFLRQSVRERGLPFMVSADTPNAVTLAAMDAAE